ncbi:PucR family transcriptional regulator ligand-binding domain-containing protein [Planotetraspora sp. A-T 1434]|uniref:PucR family transcriptional regulator n=1 Tax=Planotetraspora sp. A-T 1434 TaxID=2979219 RepID=UPI0021BDF346|nr:PucR family transcriptional regulator [Planotetraspora sp. A-T 1434]MCT9930011.1 PucR family transcriptional regulator ligand-binding domain-containing protein [Planotetraspora sp. A-T 1434]
MLLRDLLAVAELRLALLTGDDRLDREISGVLITDLPDPGRYVSGGELVLTGLMWRQEPADSERFVDALVKAGVAALGAGDARLGLVPDDLVAACRDRGLPLLEVPVEVPFGAVTEIVGRRLPGLAGTQVGELRSALGRHRRIVAAVAEGAGLDELFSLMASELGVTGAVISASGSVIAGELPEGHAVRLAREYLAAVRLPVVAGVDGPFTVFAVDRSDRAAGWALACRGELDVEIGFELASCVAMERTRMEEGRRVERRLAEQLIALACSGAADLSELSARLRTCGIDAAEPYVVVTATAARRNATEGPDPAVLGGQVVEELLGRQVVAAAGADGSVALMPLREHGTADALAARLRERTALLSAGLPGTRVSIGVSGALTGPSAIRGGVEEAGHARRLADARGGGVVTSDEIYTHVLLLATVPGDVRRSFAERLLGPLFDYDRRHQAELVRTLGSFLECAGSWNACAERLHVHVNTVRYRIRRVEELTGKNLSSMADRVDLFLALRAG